MKTATQNNWKSWKPLRGEVYLVKLDGIDSEQGGIRPAVIMSNNVGNKMGGIVTIVPMTSKTKKFMRNIHVPVNGEHGVKQDSILMTEHLRSISKQRFFFQGTPKKITKLPEFKITELEKAIKFELGFGEAM